VNRIGQAIVNAINSLLRPESPEGQAFLRRIAKKRGFTADLGTIQVELEKLNKADEAVKCFGCDMVLPHLRKQHEAYALAVEAGDTPPPIKSREAVESEFLAHLEVSKTHRNAIRSRIRAAALPIAQRFADELKAEAAIVEGEEKKRCDEYGIPHAPSPLLAELHNAADAVLLAAERGHTLAEMLPFV